MLKKQYLAGDVDDIKEIKGKEKLKATRSKSIEIVTRSRQASSNTSDIDEKLMDCPRVLWRDEKRVMWTLIFCRVMNIEPALLDGVHSANHIIREKKLFYYGFTRRHNLSICNISSVG